MFPFSSQSTKPKAQLLLNLLLPFARHVQESALSSFPISTDFPLLLAFPKQVSIAS
jgi:hypothetical protein